MAVVINELTEPEQNPGGGGPPPGIWMDRVSLTLDGELLPYVHVESFTCEEAMSTLYRLEVEFTFDVSSGDPGQGGVLRPDSFLGRRVALHVTRLERERNYCGIVTHFAGERPMGCHVNWPYYRVRLTVMPRVWVLTQNVCSEVMSRDYSTQDLITKIFVQAGFSDYDSNLASSETRMRVQYEESDFNFLARTCEEMGIFYFFDQPGVDGERIIFGDQVTAYRTRDASAYSGDFMGFPWEDRQEMCPRAQGSVGYDFVVGAADESSVTTTRWSQSTSAVQFRYERIPDNAAAFETCDQQARLRMEGSEWGAAVYTGEGNAFELMPGFFLPCAGLGIDVVMVSVHHEYSDRLGYRNHFTCIPRDTVFRPPRTTPRPTIAGTQTAVVKDVWDPDAMGRVSIEFFWDRSTYKKSCWTRVSQPWAGKDYGAYFPPQEGDEVVVSFLDGDPAQPLIVGRVYNGKCNDQHSEAHLSGWIAVNGAKIEVDHDDSNSKGIRLMQPSGNVVKIGDLGSIRIEHFTGSVIELDVTGAVHVQATARLRMEAPEVDISAGMVKINAGMVKCSGVVKCDTLISNNVISATYTPGAGNIW